MKKIFSLRKSVFLMIIIASMSLSFLAASKPEQINQTAQTKDPVKITAGMVQEQYTDGLMDNPEVIGTAIGLTEDGKECILVLTTKDISTESLPALIDNIPVRMIVTGDLSNQEISLMKILMPTLLIRGC